MLSMKFHRRHLSAVFVFAVVFVSLMAARAFATTISISTPSQEKIGTGPVTGRITLKTQNTIGEALKTGITFFEHGGQTTTPTTSGWRSMAAVLFRLIQVQPGRFSALR